jgi:hypothetical protein
MRSRLATIALCAAVVAALAAAQAPPRLSPFTVHEWGTFTSIAGQDGAAVRWLPQGGPGDLPCFVERSVLNYKGGMPGTVRMETPVLYFYSPADVTVKVDVGFRQGAITEWYPHATVALPFNAGPDGSISWDAITVSPNQAATFPVESGPSHYYKARETDATPLAAGSQVEKFLFYRGVGQFAPPISATVRADGTVVAWSPQDAPLGDLILFENRRGAMAYSVHKIAAGRVTLDRPALDDTTPTPQRDLVRILVAHGLYPKEAEAMVATWSDSWFEEGARLLYIAPRAAVDAIVPLSITPAPTDVARVFVGRMELVTPVTVRDIRLALAANDRKTLEKYGRFLEPIGNRVLAEVSPLDRSVMNERLQAAARSLTVTPNSCR